MPKWNWRRFFPSKHVVRPVVNVPTPRQTSARKKTIREILSEKRSGDPVKVYLKSAIFNPAKQITGKFVRIDANTQLVLDIGGELKKFPIGSLATNATAHLPTTKEIERAETRAHFQKRIREKFIDGPSTRRTQTPHTQK